MLGTVALLSVAGLAAISVRSNTIVLNQDRQLRMAQYAAEGAVAVAVDYLARVCSASSGYSAIIASDAVNDLPASFGNNAGEDYCTGNSCIETSADPWFSEDGNTGAELGDPLGSADVEADDDVYFDVSFENNSNDPSNSKTVDDDNSVVIRAAGVAGDTQALILVQYVSTDCSNVNQGGYPGENAFGDTNGPNAEQATMFGSVNTDTLEEDGFF